MKKEKVDKGFEFFYYNLSYRRRFIRSLCLIPWTLLVLCLFRWRGTSMVIIVPLAVVFTIIGFIQTLHNYKKWKEET